MKTWADEAGIAPPSRAIDRDWPASEGPPKRCCDRRFVAADALVHYGDLATDKRAQVTARFARMADVPAADLYLCDSCRETLRREVIIARADMPASRALRNPDAK